MSREEFIQWIIVNTAFIKDSLTSDIYWKDLVDYDSYTYDEIEVEQDKVIFRWEKKYWGYSQIETEEYSFDEFIERYETDRLKQ